MSEITIYNINNQKNLTPIVINDKNQNNRKITLDKITNPEYLKPTITKSKYETVGKIDTIKLIKILRKEGRFNYY